MPARLARVAAAGILALLALAPAALARPPAAVTRYAPWVRFHPSEKVWPDAPAAFVARSELDWVNANRRCPGAVPVEEIAAAGQVDAQRLGTGGYRIGACLRLQGHQTIATYTTHDVTAPALHGSRAHRPSGASAGFVLDLPDADRMTAPPPSAATPLTYEYVRHKYIIYWFFYRYNNRGGDKHEGDWEHLSVRLDGTDRATAAGYFAHSCPGRVYSWADLRRRGSLHDGDHPQAYIATGGHGVWPKAGESLVMFHGLRPCGLYDRTGNGRTWTTWTAPLLDAHAQPWFGFNGGWGEQYVGPLGPGPAKLGGALPPGWAA